MSLGTNNKSPVGSLTKVMVVLLAINIGLNIMIVPAFLIGKTSQLILEEDEDKLITNQQKLLSIDYLTISNNVYLTQASKQFIPELPTIHHSVADIERILHEMEPIIAKLGLIESHNSNGLNTTTTHTPTT